MKVLKIDMQTWQPKITQYKVSDFLSWQKAKSLVLSPSFQRRPVWKAGAKSLLIDTVARGLPMPPIFFREQRTNLSTFEPKREVVDGQQRIRTLLSFINPSLLDDYSPERDTFDVLESHNSELAGKKFSDFPPLIQQRMLDYEFGVHILPAEVSDKEVLQIFARMNATGVKLNDQELRNAEFFGKFKVSMYELAAEQLQRWRNWKVFTEYNIARMEEVELASEFTMLVLRGLTKKDQRAIDRLYKEKENEFPERIEFERRFRIVMDVIDDTFGQELPSTIFTKKTLFYSLFAFTYDALFGIGSKLEKRKQNPISTESITWVKKAGRYIEQGKAPKAVLDASARRTTDLGSRETILKYLQQRG